MTKREALKRFKELYPAERFKRAKYDWHEDKAYLRIDWRARSEAWNYFVDWLRRDNKITMKQYAFWSNPFQKAL